MTHSESPAYWITYREDRRPLYSLLLYVALERKENVEEFLNVYMLSELRTLTDYSNCKINWMGGETQYKLLKEYVGEFTISKVENTKYDKHLCEYIDYMYTYLHLRTATATREVYKLIPLSKILDHYNFALWYSIDKESQGLADEVGLRFLSEEETQRKIEEANRFENPVYDEDYEEWIKEHKVTE